ncbi:MAG: hypothetical protein AAF081_17495 [Actinomycetota bacterium]
MSTSIVLLVLAAGWCAYLAVWWKDARKAAHGRSNAIQSFSHGMGSLGGTTSRSLAIGGASFDLRPRSVGAAARRRHQVFAVLGTLAVFSLLAAFVLGAVAVLAHVVTDLAIIAYAYAVVQRRNLAAEREIKVQMLYPEGVTALRDQQRRTVNA